MSEDEEKRKVPKIRFPGFTDDWEQRKLSSLFEKFDDGDWIEAKDQSDSGVRLVQTGNVGVTEFIDKPDNKKWVSDDTFERLHCEEIFPGDILISRLPEPAGRACIVPETGTRMITAVDCTIARTSAENSADFIVQCLSTPGYFKWVNTCLAGGTRQRISRSMLSSYDIMIPPTKAEQQQIGTFFSNLDTLITLHQHKLDDLNELKRGLLQRMLPADGGKIPEIRFLGYTDDWKQCKLGDMSLYHNGSGHEDKQADTGKYELINLNSISINGGLKHSGKFVDEADDTLRVNDLVMVLSDVGHGDLLGRVAIIPEDNKYVLNQRVALLRPNDNVYPKFLYTVINAHQKYFKSQGAGSSQLNISKGSVIDFSPYVPSFNEQVLIGDFFFNLDNNISKLQKKINDLEELKKGLLQQMFI